MADTACYPRRLLALCAQIRFSKDRKSAWRLTGANEVGPMDIEEANAAMAAFEEALVEAVAAEEAAAEEKKAAKLAKAEAAAAKKKK